MLTHFHHHPPHRFIYSITEAQKELNDTRLQYAQKLAQQEKNKTVNQKLVDGLSADLEEIGLKLGVMYSIWGYVSSFLLFSGFFDLTLVIAAFDIIL
jgi:hypothetical protein